MAEMIPGIVVPEVPDAGLDDMVDEVGSYEPLMSFPSMQDDESLSGAFDAMIAAGLLHP